MNICKESHLDGMYEELGRHAGGNGAQECRNYGAVKETIEHVHFECICHALHLFDKMVFCLGKKLAMEVHE